MDRVSIKNYAMEVIRKNYPDENGKAEFFGKLFDNGLVDIERVLKGCINHSYDIYYKKNNCISRESLLDVAVDFDVSTHTVKNVIYKYRNVRIDF
jgi:hypothetical protein